MDGNQSMGESKVPTNSPQTTEDLAARRILIIDDDPRIRQMIQLALEEEGFAIETAADGQQGLERASRTRPALIVLDMNLPVIDGAVVADRLQLVHREPPPIILITADDRPEQRARRVGACGYLRKPFDLHDLVSLIHRGLRVQAR
jgi:DNA-binding response OmpR family regulator